MFNADRAISLVESFLFFHVYFYFIFSKATNTVYCDQCFPCLSISVNFAATCISFSGDIFHQFVVEPGYWGLLQFGLGEWQSHKPLVEIGGKDEWYLGFILLFICIMSICHGAHQNSESLNALKFKALRDFPNVKHLAISKCDTLCERVIWRHLPTDFCVVPSVPPSLCSLRSLESLCRLSEAWRGFDGHSTSQFFKQAPTILRTFSKHGWDALKKISGATYHKATTYWYAQYTIYSLSVMRCTEIDLAQAL